MPYTDAIKAKESQRVRTKRYVAKHPEKVRAAQARWRKANGEKHQISSAVSRGLPRPTRPRPSACECCGGASGKRSLAIDHCHMTGKFRGWICARCNTSIGGLGDTVAGLWLAITYLERA